MGKKCPYCGQPLHNTAFKCKRCNKWVVNEVFRELCEDDVKLIKDKDLMPFTPTLLAMMAIDLLKKDDSLEQDIQKQEEGKLNEKQQFNLLVFNSFCFFETICSFTKMKQRRRDTIKETLRVAILQGVAELFNKRVEHLPSSKVLIDHGKALYAKFQAILDGVGTNASSQLKASNAFGFIVFGDDSPISFTGLNLYAHFIETFKYMGKEFSKMFLVEEEDFDWQAILKLYLASHVI